MERKSRIQANVMKEAKTILRGLACSAAIVLALATVSAKATDYEITEVSFPVLGHYGTYVSDISNNGDVAGHLAAINTPNYKITRMDVPNIGGYCRTCLSGIDNEGVIAGSYDISDWFRFPPEREITSKKPVVYIGGQLCKFGAGFPEDFFGGAIDATKIIDMHGNFTGQIGVLLSEENKSSGDFVGSHMVIHNMGPPWWFPIFPFQLSFEAHDMNVLGDVAGVDFALEFLQGKMRTRFLLLQATRL
ncbi:MAG: hypothetical protein ISS79_04390 [Phycisphaerae bacterium]|nr:hypothetical protein [Phycisphaerae bacterium]